jgi:prevent-host-death family protein
MYNRVVRTTLSEARASLSQLLDRVEAGEEVTITRHGRDAAVLVRPDTLRTRRAEEVLSAAEQLREAMSRGASRPLGHHPVLTEERAEEMISQIRADRTVAG